MKKIEILASFEREINKLDDNLSKPVTDDSVYWINQAISKFSKERFNGNAPHRTSYEQNEKRLRDLNNLYVTYNFSDKPYIKDTHLATYDKYTFVYPNDVMFVLNEDVTISDNNGENLYDTSVFECTKDSFMYRITNSLTDFHYNHHKARPLRVVTELVEGIFTSVDLYTDKNYKIVDYTIGYLRFPNEFNLDNPNAEYTDFTDIVLYEIVKIAAQMYLENQSDRRYNTITKEVLTQE